MNFILWFFSEFFFTCNQIIRNLCKRKPIALNNFSDVASFGEISNHSEERKRETFLLPLNNSCCIVFRLVFDSRFFLSSLLCAFTELSAYFRNVALLFFSASLFANSKKKCRQNRESASSPGGIYRRSVLCHQGLNSVRKS